MFYQIVFPRGSAFFDFARIFPTFVEEPSCAMPSSQGSARRQQLAQRRQGAGRDDFRLADKAIGFLDPLAHAPGRRAKLRQGSSQERCLLAIAFDKIDRSARPVLEDQGHDRARETAAGAQVEPGYRNRGDSRRAARCPGHGGARRRQASTGATRLIRARPTSKDRLKGDQRSRMFHVKRFRLRNESRRRWRRHRSALPVPRVPHTEHAPG